MVNRVRKEEPMSQFLQFQTIVLPGHRIEIRTPDLPEGKTVTVSISLDEGDTAKRPFREVLGNYSGGQLFRSAEEVEAYLQAERDSWDK
jgi:hypothetical protein